MLSLDVLNPDAFIATKNLERDQSTTVVDLEYLARLSDDAAPVLAKAIPDSDAWHRRVVAQDGENGFGWPSANLSRWNAQQLMH